MLNSYVSYQQSCRSLACNFIKKRLLYRFFSVSFNKCSGPATLGWRVQWRACPHSHPHRQIHTQRETNRHTQTHIHTEKKEKQRAKRKSCKAETITRLSPRSKRYYFSHSRASRIQCSMAPLF